MKERIQQELQHLEQTHGVRVLLAVESGSRAWGFASPDSDYDVRFLYVHPRDWYIRVHEARDVLDAMLPDHLDFVGWDLRKALRLMTRHNTELNEWIRSPLLYHEVPPLRQQLLELSTALFNPLAALHHYRSMAGHAFEQLHDGIISLKKLFYVLRPLFACRWILQHHTQPPTAFAELRGSGLLMPEEQAWVEDLLRLKAQAIETATVTLPASQAERLNQELLQHKATQILPAPTQVPQARLDALLRQWVDPQA